MRLYSKSYWSQDIRANGGYQEILVRISGDTEYQEMHDIRRYRKQDINSDRQITGEGGRMSGNKRLKRYRSLYTSQDTWRSRILDIRNNMIQMIRRYGSHDIRINRSQ